VVELVGRQRPQRRNGRIINTYTLANPRETGEDHEGLSVDVHVACSIGKRIAYVFDPNRDVVITVANAGTGAKSATAAAPVGDHEVNVGVDAGTPVVIEVYQMAGIQSPDVLATRKVGRVDVELGFQGRRGRDSAPDGVAVG